MIEYLFGVLNGAWAGVREYLESNPPSGDGDR